ncbi:hypothetical protein OIU84_018455 [Salix udensis]|uniref:Uncharacterized protein n=1 Tax=Salix udensis TaxID=889485 RepID=A0AAD6PI98_9ROSI|nr:hypothetical protein OIU84_018455 [Salix udensis]
MDMSTQKTIWDGVLDITKVAQEKGSDPQLWALQFLDRALALNIVPPSMVLALLSDRIVPCRRSRPVAYRLYMELLKRFAFELKCHIAVPNYEMVMKSIDGVLHLSHKFGLQVTNPGILVAEFIYSIVSQLLDASLDDEGLLELMPEMKSRWATIPQEMEIDAHDKSTSRILDLMRRNLHPLD